MNASFSAAEILIIIGTLGVIAKTIVLPKIDHEENQPKKVGPGTDLYRTKREAKTIKYPEYVQRWACKNKGNFHDFVSSHTSYALLNWNSNSESSNNDQRKTINDDHRSSVHNIFPTANQCVCEDNTAAREALTAVDIFVLSCLCISMLCRIILFGRWLYTQTNKHK